MSTIQEKTSAAADKVRDVKNQKGGILNLEDQFAFYGQYHTNEVNVGIHIARTSRTTLVLTYHKPLTTIDIGAYELPVNASTLAAFGYALYFVLLEPIAGSAYAPWLIFQGLSACWFHENVPNARTIAWTVFGISWIAQFVGHGKFEGRAPALLDNLFQSLVLAVFFVFMEVLFFLGYRPELHKRLQNRIGKEVLKYRQPKRAGAGKSEAKDPKAVDQQTAWRG